MGMPALDLIVLPIKLCAPEPAAEGRALKSRWPGLVVQWLRYHVDLVGAQVFRLYDLDGSFELPMRHLASDTRRVEYVPKFAHTLHPQHFGEAIDTCPLCTEMLAYQDCLLRFR